MLSAFARKKGKGKSGPNVLDEFNQEGGNAGDLKKGCLLFKLNYHEFLALKLLEGGGKGKGLESKYREVCWKLEERGQNESTP